MRGKIDKLLTDLKFFGIAEKLDEELALAEKTGSPIVETLYRLLAEEFAHRQQRSIQYRLKQAKMPWNWTLKTFPFEKQPSVNKSQIMAISGLSFIERAENIVFIGEPGVGKTGLATALLYQALINGHRGRFYNAQNLMDELYASLADRTTSILLKRLSNYRILLIDELGYLTLKPEQVNAFFKLMSERYGRSSTIITTNLEYEDWYGLFERESMVKALLDRIRHHCITIRIDGPSLRTPQENDKSQTPALP